MFKLGLGLENAFKKIRTDIVDSFDKLYTDLTRQSSLNNETTKTEQSRNQQKVTNKPLTFRISTNKQASLPINSKINSIKTPLQQKSKQFQSVIKLEQQEHLLLFRKKKLLTQLNEINFELKTRKQHQSRIRQVNKPQTDIQETTRKAEELVKRMNKQRQEFSIRRRKSIQELNQSIIKSIEQFHMSLAEEQQMKEIRRQEIQNRINERKKKAIARGISVDMTHSLIQQFIDNTLKLQYHSQISPSGSQNDNIKIEEKLNPEHFESKIVHLPHIKTEQSKKSLKSSTKSYSKSPFLERILKQEERNKKQQYLKTLEKKRVFLKHKEYAQKIRDKARKYGSEQIFLT